MTGENPLHRARVERGIDLAEVARRTCLSPQVVQKIDAGRFDQLPAGVYARSYVRAFATAVDLDPEITLTGLAERLPRAEDPLPVLRDVAERSTPAWMRQYAAVIRASLARTVSAGTRLSEAWSAEGGRLRWFTEPWSRLTLEAGRGAIEAALGRRGVRASDVSSSDHPDVAGGRALPGRRFPSLGATPESRHGSTRRRIAAMCVDAAVLVALYMLLVQLTAWTSDVSARAVLESAGAGVTAVWALLAVQYFVLLGGIGGRTPGAWVFRLRHTVQRPGTAPLGLRAILYRTVLY